MRYSRWLLPLMLIVALAVTGCAARPDTAVRPAPSISFAPLKHPFHGAHLLIDDQSAAARWRATTGADWLRPITRTPQARWLTSPQDVDALPVLVSRARDDALLVLVAYYIPDRGCDHHRQGAPTDGEYLAWIDHLIDTLGRTEAAVIVEPDAVAADCFDPGRARLLRTAVLRLAQAGHFVYLDAGHSRWRPSGEIAQRLLSSGIQNAEGFAVNVANRQSTADSARWGRELSDLVGGREFVIDTSRNGLGAPPADQWCNPARQSLGDRPTTRPDLPGVAALLWIKRPGESDGECGGETTYEFSPRQAAILIKNSRWVAEPIRAEAAEHTAL